MLKRLFYASASVLMPALAYHLGATSATAQAPSLEAAQFATSPGSFQLYLSYESGRTYYWSAIGGAPSRGIPLTFTAPQAVGGPVPGTAPVLTTYSSEYANIALLANGDLYGSGNSGPWAYAGNVLSAPTPAAQATFGQLKAMYRK